jgi:hypothetical protein
MRTAERIGVSWSELLGFASAGDPAVVGSRRRTAVSAFCVVALIFALMSVNIAASNLGYEAAALDSLVQRLDVENMELTQALAINTTDARVALRAKQLGLAKPQAGQIVTLDSEPKGVDAVVGSAGNVGAF